ncbi:MAG TPA: aquaporin, partial [Methylomirabilota bacterium]|nr:aquaporin [Methylomirabilota bacterium]
MRRALGEHWPEYLMEAAGLGLFMLSACAFTTLLFHPGSPITSGVEPPILRRCLMGLAMALTAVSIIYSPWGRRSGAHLNPAVTLTFWRLDKIAGWDAAFYVTAQFAGGIAGVLAARLWLGAPVADPGVHYAVTVPGPAGPLVALAAEIVISFVLMLVVLGVSNSRAADLTGLCAGALVATYIAVEAPLSGMSMNPARTVASAVPAQTWTALWVYFTGPLLGMLLAADVHLWLARGRNRGASAPSSKVACAKLSPHGATRCIFRCAYAERAGAKQPSAGSRAASRAVAAGL